MYRHDLDIGVGVISSLGWLENGLLAEHGHGHGHRHNLFREHGAEQTEQNTSGAEIIFTFAPK